MDALKNLGIEPKLLLAQIVNFFILLFLLWKFLYKPILKVFDERSKKIKESLDQAEKVKQEAKKTEKIRQEILQNAKKEAENTLNKAEKIAEKNKKEIINQASLEAKKLLEKTQQEIDKQKKNILESVRKDISSLTLISLEKILGKLED